MLLVSVNNGNGSGRVVVYGAISLLLVLLEVLSFGSLAKAKESPQNSISSEDMERICQDKKFKITSIAQMNQVINAANLVDGLCRKRYMASLYELDAILRIPREDLCDDKSFEAIKSYHFRFISPMRHLNRRATQFEPDPKEVVRAQLHPEPRKYSLEFDEHDQILMIPIAVRHFWLSFALQLSGQCKRNLLDNLKSDTAKYLGEDDFAVKDVFNKESPIGQIMADGITLIDFDNALYMPELEGEIKGQNQPSNQQVFVKTETTKESSLYTLVSACQTRFKPIYQKLLIPVIRLVKLGYDYQGDKLTVEERQELAGPEVKSWLGLVNVCETFERVIVLKSPEGDNSESGEQQPGGAIKSECESSEDGCEEGDNKLETMSRQEVEQMISNEEQRPGGGDLSLIEAENTLKYTVTKLNRMDNELWITSERKLDLELSKKAGNTNPFAFKGFLRRVGAKIRRTFAKLDPDKFAHYRHNSLWYAGIFNLISSLTNSLSTGITAVFVVIILAA